MNFNPIAIVRSPWRQKFAIPRQPNLVSAATGELHFAEEYADPNTLRGIEQFSHLWLIFVFHETAAQGWSATVAPPRLGGNERVGVFATRSMYRPNPLGLSVVEFVGVEQRGKQLILRVRGLDLLDGTPILDIKPYLPYADALPQASGGFAAATPGKALELRFTPQARLQLQQWQQHYPQLEALITQVLQQDPRPAQHVRQDSRREFAMLLYELNIRWRFDAGVCEVLEIAATQQTQFPPRSRDQ